MADWVTISSLATAGGTLVLAIATFGSVRSANRAARVAEESLLAGLRPLLVPSREGDPPLKVGFADGHWVHVAGSSGTADVTDQAVYLTMSLRNVGTGLAVMHGWRIETENRGLDIRRPEVEDFRRLTRDLYLAAGDFGFWQGAIREPTEPDYLAARKLIEARERILLSLLYGDFHGGQRVISLFSLVPRQVDDGWLVTVARHWNVDRPDPR
jgi:hypothetical protein